MKKIFAIFGIGLFLLATLCFSVTPGGRAVWNRWFFQVQKADDATRYETLRKVEDTCRAMIASYDTDKLTFEQYIGSDNAEKQGWAEQAKMRANKTASVYNGYISRNSFVWAGSVPEDIRLLLPTLE